MYLENTSITEIVILCKYSRQAIPVKHWAIQITISAAHDCEEALCHRKRFFHQHMIVRKHCGTGACFINKSWLFEIIVGQEAFLATTHDCQEPCKAGSHFVNKTWLNSNVLQQEAILSTTNACNSSIANRVQFYQQPMIIREHSKTEPLLSAAHDCKKAFWHRKLFYQQPMIVRKN